MKLPGARSNQRLLLQSRRRQSSRRSLCRFAPPWPVCSIGSEVCSRVALDAFDYLDAPPTKVAGKDVPMPYAANLEKLALPTVDDLIQAVKAVCYKA